jgi:hypothetical protein
MAKPRANIKVKIKNMGSSIASETLRILCKTIEIITNPNNE